MGNKRKLDEELVGFIRESAKSGFYTWEELGDMVGRSPEAIKSIAKGKSYKSLNEKYPPVTTMKPRIPPSLKDKPLEERVAADERRRRYQLKRGKRPSVKIVKAIKSMASKVWRFYLDNEEEDGVRDFMSFKPLHAKWEGGPSQLSVVNVLNARYRYLDTDTERGDMWVALKRPLATWDLSDIDENGWESELLLEIFEAANWHLVEPGQSNKKGIWEGKRWAAGVPSDILATMSWEEFQKKCD